ncbi:MAG: LamG domain-containing protein [Candidatus Hydrogenedentes bacterium]|nr:LamG domain-containing protein [Candidatus Hydrogenedentota bacterium]
MNILLIGSIVCLAFAAAENPKGLVAHYTFDEGSGTVLHDRSGNGHDGAISGATWISPAEGGGLQFGDGSDSNYVDFGDNHALKIAGDSTILAWVRLDASPYPDDATNWTVVDCERYRAEGFVLRIDGGSSRVTYRASQEGADQYAFGATVLSNREVHFLAVVREEDMATVYVNGLPDASFTVRPQKLGPAPFRISAAGQPFRGTIFEVSLLNRAISANEIAAHFWRGAKRYHKEGAREGQFSLESYIYYDDREARADVAFLGVMPLIPGEEVRVALARQGGEVLASHTVEEIPREGRGQYTFPLDGLADGEYELRAELAGAGRTARTATAFRLPAPNPVVPSPKDVTIGPLPAPPTPIECHVEATPGGGTYVNAGGTRFALESSFSVPNGGDNRLVCAGALDASGESQWRLVHSEDDRVEARGQFYTVARKLRTEPGRIVVTDTIANLTAEPLGLIFHNRLTATGEPFEKALVAAKETVRPVDDRPLKFCPNAFLVKPEFGAGLVALDDVYIVQSRGATDGQTWVDLYSREFALDAGASYTLEWAVYANVTGDYYDFVNAIRRDERRNEVTVEGGLSFLQGTQSKRDVSLVPGPNYFALREPKYVTLACLSWCTDDPSISVEGIEFVDFPQERKQVRAMMDALATVRPDAKGMFHVAHQLYATNRPDDRFPDSRVINADGTQVVYPYEYANGAYFSAERVADNWRWWIFYPTLENSFGKALLDSVDVMMDEMGAEGVFSDGFLFGYGAEYTYDRWDGHSADIDPATHLITRRKASVMLITQEAMAAWCRKIWGKGGVVIANGVVPTRSLCALPVITDKEVTEGPDVALLPTPVTLGNPAVCDSEEGVYKDVLSKLRWGNLYFYYNEPAALAYESVPKRMYPITVQEVHAGYVKGKERLVTMHSGLYGWMGDRDLHLAYRYDGRGHPIRAAFVSAVDADSVRTQVSLDENECAVIERVPIQIESTLPVHVIAERDAGNLHLYLNGRGAIRIIAPNAAPREMTLDGPHETVLQMM